MGNTTLKRLIASGAPDPVKNQERINISSRLGRMFRGVYLEEFGDMPTVDTAGDWDDAAWDMVRPMLLLDSVSVETRDMVYGECLSRFKDAFFSHESSRSEKPVQGQQTSNEVGSH